jgi:hypothetical protein
MKKFFLENLEKERIKLLYESYGIILNEDSIWGTLARKALSFIGKNEDDIAKLFKTTEVALAKNMDDIVLTATKSKAINQLDDIQIKLMHIFNPSGAAENIAVAQQKTRNFLNGYAKSKGKSGWQSIRDEVKGVTPSSQNASSSSSAGAATSAVRDMMKGQRVSNRWVYFTDPRYANSIDWGKVLNAKNMDDYNKIIAKAIDTNDFKHISSGGFEKFGIPNFRDYLRNNISKVNEVDPVTGRWSVIFK